MTVDKAADKLAALAKFPEVAHYHMSAEKYADHTRYATPKYARVLALDTFTLAQNKRWGPGTESVKVRGIAIVGAKWDASFAVHNTAENVTLFRERFNLSAEDAGTVSIITENTLRGWRDAAPFRAADKVRDERASRQRAEERERSQRKAEAFARAESLAADLSVSLGVTVTAERTSYGNPRLSISLDDAETLAVTHATD